MNVNISRGLASGRYRTRSAAVTRETKLEHIWLKSYPKGMPAKIALDDLGSIGAFFERSVSQYPQRAAFISGATGRSLSYLELDLLSARFAGHLQSLGLPPGARIGLMMPNLLQYPICQLGALRAGFVVVNTNPMYTPRELEHQLRDAGVQAVVILENFAHILAKVIARTPVKHVLVTGVADLMPLPLQWMAKAMMKAKGLLPPYQLPGHQRLKAVLNQTDGPRFQPVEVKPGDLAFLQYTGGTTGVSKGAMLTHLNVLANSRQAHVWTEPFFDLTQAQIAITALPMYHIFAMSVAINILGLGGTNVLVADPRNTKAFVKILSKYRFAMLPAVNTLFNNLLNEPSFAKVDFSALRVSIGGGTAVQRAVAERWQQLTQSPLCEGYGLTECSPNVCVNPLDRPEYSGSIGLPLPSTEVSLRDENGEEVATGERGELCVRGPQVMQGYWMRPEETAAVMTRDGFLRTGDVATIDEDGFLRIVDRLKDLVLVSGFNVYPNEIEEVVAMHPGVNEVAAIGRPDEASGEAIHLCIVRKDPALSKDDVIKHCKQSLTGYKVPRHVHFMEELPKSPVGKILRRQLREKFADDTAQTVQA
jgi:long-chain acyl-CoA synthetase